MPALRLYACLLLALFLLSGSPVAASAQSGTSAPIKLRASVDTSATHGRTVLVGDFLKQLEQASGGRIQTELFHSGQLFRDRDVAKALRQGSIEMAIPGTWVLGGFVPDADILQLPVFYGRSAEFTHRLMDGAVGTQIDRELEQKLAVKILGPWLDLGFGNYYSTTRPLSDFKDLEGLKIRNSGGAAQFARAKFFGAIPNMTAWPDVPLALSQGNFDALSTTNESLVSAKLWEAGVKYGFEDHQYLALYVPMVSEIFWKKLPPDLQKLVLDLWARNIPDYRKRMLADQEEARRTLEEHGVKFTDPTPQQLAATRGKMLAIQDGLVAELKMTPALVQQATAEAAKAP